MPSLLLRHRYLDGNDYRRLKFPLADAVFALALGQLRADKVRRAGLAFMLK